MGDQYQTLLPQIIELAAAASDVILELYTTEIQVDRKIDDTPVTEADMAADRFIVAGLQQIAADIPVLTEESVSIPFAQRQTWSRYWLVDPLDGTREFIKRNGEFTVNIALVENGVAVLGVVHQPVTGVCYYARQGGGAFKQEKNASPVQIQVRTKPENDIVIAGSRSHWDAALDDFIGKIGQHQIIRMGSSLKSCLVAEGAADIYLKRGPTSEWDTAAAQVVVEEAGGGIVTLDMQPLRYNTKESLLNPHFMVIGDDAFPWQDYL